MCPVLAHEQPAGQTRANFVKPLASRSQRLLVEPHQQAGLNHLAQRGAGVAFLPQGLCINAPTVARPLNQGAPRRLGQAQHQLGPEHGFAPHHAYLQRWVGVYIDHQ